MLDEGNPKLLLQTVADYKADILIAGGRNMYTALKARIPFWISTKSGNLATQGYEGMLELVRQLCLTLESPVWEAVRKARPGAQVQVRLSPWGPRPKLSALRWPYD